MSYPQPLKVSLLGQSPNATARTIPSQTLASHQQHTLLPQHPHAPYQSTSSLQHRPMSNQPSRIQVRQTHTARPYTREDPRRRTRKIVGDGYEANYHQNGPSNRLLLSLKSGLPTQVDWALSRLAQYSAAHRDLSCESLPGLAETLVQYVRRVCDAVAGKPDHTWQPESCTTPDVGIGAPGEGGFQGATTWYGVVASRKQQRVVISFEPSQVSSHADLLRRALESALILRNMATQSSNARYIASIKGFYILMRDVLALPAFHLDRSSQVSEACVDLQLDELGELRLYFLDILEGLANKVVLKSTQLADQQEATSAIAAAGDDIFAGLLQMALLTNDRALLIGSLKCLSAMAAVDKNESAFVEHELPDGTCSPGLLARCVELLPLTNDLELLEAALDLLYQLVCIGNNGFRLTASAQKRNSMAMVRLLTRNLQIGRTVWERDHKLFLHRDWAPAVPSKLRESIRKEREARVKLANETPEERAQKKKLSAKERNALAGLTEPERGIAWMKTVFKGNPVKEVTQMEFWTTYKEEFGNDQSVALQPAADLIRTVSQIFPGAAAMVIQGVNGAPNRFIIRGIEVHEREQSDPYRCCWKSCPAPATKTVEAQQSHAKTHASFAADGRCLWLNCDFVVDHETDSDAQAILLLHVLTHLSVTTEVAPTAAEAGLTKAALDDEELREAAKASHTGLAPDFEKATYTNGTRYISGKRNADGERVHFDLQASSKDSAAVKSNAASNMGTGTVDSPGLLTFEVVRTPSAGADDWPSPQGPAYVSLLILRMLARNAAHLLKKAGTALPTDEEDDADAAVIRGEGEDKFGLPLPANFVGGETTTAKDEQDEGDAEHAAGDAHLPSTEAWAVESGLRLMEAISGVEEELVLHSSQNDILGRYINETLVELQYKPTQASIDPLVVAMSED